MPHLRPLLLLICCLQLPAAEPSYAELPAAARELVDRIIALNQVLEPELDPAAVRTDFAALVEVVRADLAGKRHPQTVLPVLARRLLGERQVGYLSNRYWRDSSFVAALQRRRGNCLATTTLYVAVGRALELPIHAVFVPEHAFACWADGDTRINLETTAGGRAIPDAAYLARFDNHHGDRAYYGWMEPLNDDHLLAELAVIAAGHLAGQGDHAGADALIAQASEALPWRRDLELTRLKWAADASGERRALRTRAQAIADDPEAPRAARLAALHTLANEYAAKLDRAAERDALLRAYGLAPWHDRPGLLRSLSTCLRGLRDHTGAVLCMELVVAADPDDPYARAWLAGMLSEADRLDEALTQIERARDANPEDVWMATMHAGLLVLAGQREAGRALYESIEAPRTGLENYETNRAWFLAVWGDRDEFYPQFERALSTATDPGVLSWIAEDDDLDPYREEERFIALVDACRERLLGAEAASEDETP